MPEEPKGAGENPAPAELVGGPPLAPRADELKTDDEKWHERATNLETGLNQTMDQLAESSRRLEAVTQNLQTTGETLVAAIMSLTQPPSEPVETQEPVETPEPLETVETVDVPESIPAAEDASADANPDVPRRRRIRLV